MTDSQYILGIYGQPNFKINCFLSTDYLSP